MHSLQHTVCQHYNYVDNRYGSYDILQVIDLDDIVQYYNNTEYEDIEEFALKIAQVTARRITLTELGEQVAWLEAEHKFLTKVICHSRNVRFTPRLMPVTIMTQEQMTSFIQKCNPHFIQNQYLIKSTFVHLCGKPWFCDFASMHTPTSSSDPLLGVPDSMTMITEESHAQLPRMQQSFLLRFTDMLNNLQLRNITRLQYQYFAVYKQLLIERNIVNMVLAYKEYGMEDLPKQLQGVHNCTTSTQHQDDVAVFHDFTQHDPEYKQQLRRKKRRALLKKIRYYITCCPIEIEYD